MELEAVASPQYGVLGDSYLGNCARESVLHILAKDILASNMKNQTSFTIYYSSALGDLQQLDIGLQEECVPILVEKEYSLIDGIISDIGIVFDNGLSIAIEIIVSHDLEDRTLQRYLDENLPVFCIYPTWDQAQISAWPSVHAGKTYCLTNGSYDCARHSRTRSKVYQSKLYHVWGGYWCFEGNGYYGNMIMAWGPNGVMLRGSELA